VCQPVGRTHITSDANGYKPALLGTCASLKLEFEIAD